VFQGFSKAKSANGGSILSTSQFLILPQLPQKIKLASKVVKVDSKIIISILRSKSLNLTVGSEMIIFESAVAVANIGSSLKFSLPKLVKHTVGYKWKGVRQ
jgi:hypothetical protein